jgi:hypothetical protein
MILMQVTCLINLSGLNYAIIYNTNFDFKFGDVFAKQTQKPN